MTKIIDWLFSKDERPRYCFGARVEDDITCKGVSRCSRIKECVWASTETMHRQGILKDFLRWIRNK